MYLHQYVQHDWPPLAWALMLLFMACAVGAVMVGFLVAANHSYDAAQRPPREEAEPLPQAQQAPVIPPRVRHP